jgi:hypothetical protein
MAVASLNSSLETLEKVRDKQAEFLARAKVDPNGIAAFKALIDHHIRVTLELAVAVKAAAAGDTAPAQMTALSLRLDEVSIS